MEDDVEKQHQSNGKLVGGITGKGFMSGQSGNPAGRPKGKTIKERVLEWLETHPEDMEAFVKHFVKDSRELAWQMVEGKPPQDITTGGEKLPSPIYGGISKHNSDEKDIPAQ